MGILHEMYGKNIIYGGSNMENIININETKKVKVMRFSKKMAKKYGHEAAVLYAKIEFLQKFTTDPDRYCHGTQPDFTKWTGLSRAQQEKAAYILQKAGLLDKKTKYIEGTYRTCTHYKLVENNETTENNESELDNVLKGEMRPTKEMIRAALNGELDLRKEAAEQREQALKKAQAEIAEEGDDEYLYYDVDIAKKHGLVAAILLSYIEMISKKVIDITEGVFQKTAKELAKVLAFTEGQISYAKKKLVENKLIATTVKCVEGITRNATHFAPLRVCEKGVESVLKTIKLTTNKFFWKKVNPKSSIDDFKNQHMQIKNIAGANLKNSIPTINNKINNKISTKISNNNSAYLNKDVYENGYNQETTHFEVENLGEKDADWWIDRLPW